MALAAQEGFTEALYQVNEPMRKTLTYDPGKEMARHQKLTFRIDLSVFLQEELVAIAWKFSTQPRKRHGFRAPIEVYAE